MGETSWTPCRTIRLRITLSLPFCYFQQSSLTQSSISRARALHPLSLLPLGSLGNRTGSHLFGSQAIQRGCGRLQHVEHQVDLSPVMCLMLHHGAQPLPDSDRRASRGLAFASEVRVA